MIDVILPSGHRPHRLNTTLSGLLLQKIDSPKRLILVQNSGYQVAEDPQIQKLLRALCCVGWSVRLETSSKTSISAIKLASLELAEAPVVVLLDDDVIFTRHDTIEALRWVITEYDVAAVSPLAYDVDCERPVLNEYAFMYGLTKPDEYGVSEGNIALGLCICFVRKDYDQIRHLMCPDFPYMEDQVLVHFLKRLRGYAFMHRHILYHASYPEPSKYEFDDLAVVHYLEERNSKNAEYSHLLELRREERDGADFSKPICQRSASSLSASL
jgi:hypothetical protein